VFEEKVAEETFICTVHICLSIMYVLVEPVAYLQIFLTILFGKL